MKKLLMIAMSNLKKKRGEAVTIGILIGFTALLLYVSFSTLFNLEKVEELSRQNSNLADYELILPLEIADEAEAIIVAEQDVIACERNTAAHSDGFKLLYGENYEKSLEATPDIYCIEDTFTISKITADYDINTFPENGIILTKYMEKAQGFKKGQTIKLELKDNTYEMVVVDFSEDAMTATPLNVSAAKYYVGKKMYDELMTNSDIRSTCSIRAKIAEDVDRIAFEKNLMQKLYIEIPELGNSVFFSLNWVDMLHGVEMMPRISMVIILSFAIVLIFITIAVIWYNIKNFMDENMTNTGILKASGYTSLELNLSLTLQFAIVAIIGSLCGTCIGFAGFKPLGNAIAALSGIEWRMGPDPVSAVLAVAITAVVVTVIVLLLGRKYKKIFVLDALRGGISTHNFKRNHLPLNKSKLTLPAGLGIKSFLFDKGKNVSVVLVIAFLAFAACSGVFIYFNFGVSGDSILRMSGIEMRTVYVTGDTKYGELDPMTIEGVTDYLYGNNGDYTLRAGENESSCNVDYWDDPSKLTAEELVEGRLPENEKEIVLAGSIRKELGVDIGDIVYLDNGEKYCEFMVVGFDQKINHFGRKAMITMDGIRRLLPNVEPSALYIGIEEGQTYESMRAVVEKAYPNGSVNNGDSIMADTVSGVTNVMYLICLAFLIATYVVVFFILYMIGKSRIVEEKKQLGVYKALGFTTGQLVYKNVVSVIPVVTIGGALGILFTYVGINPLITLMFSAIGFGRSHYPHSLVWYVLVVVLMIVDAIIVTIVASSKIRKIEPVKMIQE